MSKEEIEAAAATDSSDDDDDDDLFADSDDEKAKEEEKPVPTTTRVTRSIVAAIKTEGSTPLAVKANPEPAAAVKKEVDDQVKKESTASTVYASIPRKNATPSSPTATPSTESKSLTSSPIPKKATSKTPVASTTPEDSDARAVKFGLPKGTIIPSSIRDDVMRQSGGKMLETLRGLRSITLINDALKEYDDAVQIKGESIRNHGAYLYGVVKRYASVQERAARAGTNGASLPMGNELTPPVHQRLQKLVQNGFCTADELTKNDKVHAKMKMLSEKDALSAIEEMASVDRSTIRAFGSYFMGILNRYMRGEKQQQNQQNASGKGNNQRNNKGNRGRSSKQDPDDGYRRERSRDRDRSNSADHSHYGPRSSHGNNNSHLPNYDTRRDDGPYGSNNVKTHNQYPPQSKHNFNGYQNNNGNPSGPGVPPHPSMGGGPMGRPPPPPPPPPPRQSVPGLPPQPPSQYQAPPSGPQMQQQQPPPSHYGSHQQQPQSSSYGQQYGTQQQSNGIASNNSYYGSQNHTQQQQSYGTSTPSPYASTSVAGGTGQPPQQQPYMQQQQPPQSGVVGAPQTINGYPQQQQQPQPQQQSQSSWQQQGMGFQTQSSSGGLATQMPAGIEDILGIADKAASAVQALQNQNRLQNSTQYQAPVQNQQYQQHQASPPQASQMQQQPQQSYQTHPSYQTQQHQQQQIQQQAPQQQQQSSGNQYGGYAPPAPSPAPYSNAVPSPYAPQQQVSPMGQPNQQQQQPSYQGHMGGQQPPHQAYSQQQYQATPPNPPSQRGGNRGRHGRGKSRHTTATMMELPVSVQHMIHNIQNTRQVDGPLDEGILGMVKDLPEHLALQSLQKFIAIDKNSMRSKTAYLAGVLRRELERIHRR